jgi:hypothetical protein
MRFTAGSGGFATTTTSKKKTSRFQLLTRGLLLHWWLLYRPQASTVSKGAMECLVHELCTSFVLFIADFLYNPLNKMLISAANPQHCSKNDLLS